MKRLSLPLLVYIAGCSTVQPQEKQLYSDPIVQRVETLDVLFEKDSWSLTAQDMRRVARFARGLERGCDVRIESYVPKKDKATVYFAERRAQSVGIFLDKANGLLDPLLYVLEHPTFGLERRVKVIARENIPQQLVDREIEEPSFVSTTSY